MILTWFEALTYFVALLSIGVVAWIEIRYFRGIRKLNRREDDEPVRGR